MRRLLFPAFLVASGFSICFILIVGPQLGHEHDVYAYSGACGWRLHELFQATLMYSEDSDGYAPTSRWNDGLQYGMGSRAEAFPYGYLLSPTVVNDPALEDEKYGYAMDKAIVGERFAALKDPASRALYFDSTVNGRNAVARLNTLPKPARHFGVNHVVFADGHLESPSPN